MAAAMGIELLAEEQYQELQKLGNFDNEDLELAESSPLLLESSAAAGLFGDRRFGRVFVYHNGAQSYHVARAFRSSLRVQIWTFDFFSQKSTHLEAHESLPSQF
jgi:Protein of unknown function (DUF4256)